LQQETTQFSKMSSYVSALHFSKAIGKAKT
jgi:hypothetical protein